MLLNCILMVPPIHNSNGAALFVGKLEALFDVKDVRFVIFISIVLVIIEDSTCLTH